MKARPWEKEDAQHEDIPIIDNHVPKSFVVEDGRLKGVMFEKVEAKYDETGNAVWCRRANPKFSSRRTMCCRHRTGKYFPVDRTRPRCRFRDKWDMPIVDKMTFQSTHPKVFFGGDAAFGPENVITAVAHGHQAAVSIDLFCKGEDLSNRLDPMVNLISQKMGIHEWAYDSEIEHDPRYVVPQAENFDADQSQTGSRARF